MMRGKSCHHFATRPLHSHLGVLPSLLLVLLLLLSFFQRSSHAFSPPPPPPQQQQRTTTTTTTTAIIRIQQRQSSSSRIYASSGADWDDYTVPPGTFVDVSRMEVVGSDYSNDYPIDSVISCEKPGVNFDGKMTQRAQVVVSLGPEPNGGGSGPVESDFELAENEYIVKRGTKIDKYRMYVLDFEPSPREGGTVLRTLTPGLLGPDGNTLNLAEVIASSGPNGDWKEDRHNNNNNGSMEGDPSTGRSSRGFAGFSSGSLGPVGGPGKQEGYIYGPTKKKKKKQSPLPPPREHGPMDRHRPEGGPPPLFDNNGPPPMDDRWDPADHHPRIPNADGFPPPDDRYEEERFLQQQRERDPLEREPYDYPGQRPPPSPRREEDRRGPYNDDGPYDEGYSRQMDRSSSNNSRPSEQYPPQGGGGGGGDPYRSSSSSSSSRSSRFGDPYSHNTISNNNNEPPPYYDPRTPSGEYREARGDVYRMPSDEYGPSRDRHGPYGPYDSSFPQQERDMYADDGGSYYYDEQQQQQQRGARPLYDEEPYGRGEPPYPQDRFGRSSNSSTGPNNNFNNDFYEDEKRQYSPGRQPQPSSSGPSSSSQQEQQQLGENEYSVNRGTKIDKTRMYVVDFERSDTEGGTVLRTITPGLMGPDGSTINLAEVIASSGPNGDWKEEKNNPLSEYDLDTGRTSEGFAGFSSGSLGPPGGPGKQDGYTYGPSSSSSGGGGTSSFDSTGGGGMSDSMSQQQSSSYYSEQPPISSFGEQSHMGGGEQQSYSGEQNFYDNNNPYDDNNNNNMMRGDMNNNNEQYPQQQQPYYPDENYMGGGIPGHSSSNLERKIRSDYYDRLGLGYEIPDNGSGAKGPGFGTELRYPNNHNNEDNNNNNNNNNEEWRPPDENPPRWDHDFGS